MQQLFFLQRGNHDTQRDGGEQNRSKNRIVKEVNELQEVAKPETKHDDSQKSRDC